LIDDTQCSETNVRELLWPDRRRDKINLKSFQYWKRKMKLSKAPALVDLPLPKSLPFPVSEPCSRLCIIVEQR
jgi:hypothetical protein